MAALFTRRNQLQWLALLAIAVVLPTVSLLWFLSHVVANERLVVRQKLAALYQDKLADANARTESLLAARLAALDKIAPGANPYPLFRRAVLQEDFQGVIILEAAGAANYPRLTDVVSAGPAPDSPLAGAWQAEFAGGQFAEAAALYERFTADTNPRLAVAARTGRSRCLRKLGRLDEAIAECRKAAFISSSEIQDPTLLFDVETARLMLLSLLCQPGATATNLEWIHRTAAALVEDLYQPSANRAWLPANQNFFVATKLLQTLREASLDNGETFDNLRKLAAAEELSIAAAQEPGRFAASPDCVSEAVVGGKTICGLRHRSRSSTLLLLLAEPGMDSLLAGYREAFGGSASVYRITDASGGFVAGPLQPRDQPFATAALPAAFPNWKAQLYFRAGDVFEKAANRQIAVYTWTGVLVIVLMLAVGGLATRAIGRQIRLNRMKNDFIATVSHELKTPLASMRVLVDTLLEGNVRDEAQSREYLRLTARENERLSRMIDNFLTFSRMERNKRAFAITDARPAAVAADAVESVRAKFAANDCHLTVEIAENLPEIQADHDAIVTVLVNLLDNACKYTGADKRIALRVFAQNGAVCFTVSDNGIGLARRHTRRIFERFYQVDNSLARKVEGCGLGLSIVKFIMDAHKGSVSVESKPGKGSVFTVRLPVSKSRTLERS